MPRSASRGFTDQNSLSIRNAPTQHVGSIAVRGADEVGGRTERRGSVCMTESARHRPHVDPRRKQVGRSEVAEVVEADARQLQLGAKPPERVCDSVGPPRLEPSFVIREHKRLRVHRHSAELSTRLHAQAMALQLQHRPLVDRDAPRLMRLRLLLDDLMFSRFEDRALDQKLGALIIDVGPAEPTQLASTCSGDDGEMDERRQLGVPTRCCSLDQTCDLLRRRRTSGRFAKSWR